MGVGLARLCEEDLLGIICGTHASYGYLALCIHRVCFDRDCLGWRAYGGEVEILGRASVLKNRSGADLESVSRH
jgi:hypothetical protein